MNYFYYESKFKIKFFFFFGGGGGAALGRGGARVNNFFLQRNHI